MIQPIKKAQILFNNGTAILKSLFLKNDATQCENTFEIERYLPLKS